MSVRYSCPNCGTTAPGRPILAFRRPPAELRCARCSAVMRVPFSDRLFWCFQLSITTLFLPLSVWMLSGDIAMLGRPQTWVVGFFAGLFCAMFFSFFTALPLTFLLQPRPLDRGP